MGSTSPDVGSAIARLLDQKNYNVEVFIVRHSDKTSEDFNTNLERLKNIAGIRITDLKEGDKLPDINNDIVIDGILGSGLTKPVKGFIASVINYINSSRDLARKVSATIISIDVPSGLFCNESSESLNCTVIKANHTLTFQLPKFAFMFAENEKYVGKWEVLILE